ncbi:Uncharacterised protein [uncultured archaeon]|nr:Uncharacterised protein [uncultured archaeon]
MVPERQGIAEYCGGMGKMALLKKFARKDVLIRKTSGASMPEILLLAFAARRLGYEAEGGWQLLNDNRNAALHAAKIILFPFALAFWLAAFAAFVPVKAIMRPKTEEYGAG